MRRCSPRSLHRYGDLIVRSRAVRDTLTARPDADVAGMPKAGTAMADCSLMHRRTNHASAVQGKAAGADR
jgi:hypothetical protein